MLVTIGASIEGRVDILGAGSFWKRISWLFGTLRSCLIGSLVLRSRADILCVNTTAIVHLRDIGLRFFHHLLSLLLLLLKRIACN